MDSDPTPFFSDLKDVKKNFASIISVSSTPSENRDGCGAGAVPLTYGSGSGRPNTANHCLSCYLALAEKWKSRCRWESASPFQIRQRYSKFSCNIKNILAEETKTMNPHLFELLHQDPDVTKHFNCEKKYILTFVNKYFSPKEKLAFETDYPPPPQVLKLTIKSTRTGNPAKKSQTKREFVLTLNHSISYSSKNNNF
jgi:hypothetical protein